MPDPPYISIIYRLKRSEKFPINKPIDITFIEIDQVVSEISR